MSGGSTNSTPPTPLTPILILTFLASIGTGVIWNGVPFIATEEFAYGDAANLSLSLAMGTIYVAAALLAGPLTRRVQRRLRPRSLLAGVLGVQSLVCFGPLVVRDQWMLWLVAAVTSLMSALLWPIVESYLASGRHGVRMRRAIGSWNLVWTTAVALSLVMMAPIVKHDARMVIVSFGAANMLALVALRWFQPSPGAHEEAHVQANVGDEYPLLLQSARVLLPISYILSAAMTPLLPHRLHELGVDAFRVESIGWTVSWQTPAAATWMLFRVFTMAAMWRIGSWHGRWGTLLTGAAMMTAGFALVVLGPAVAWVLTGFAMFGVGMGIVYFASLYYAMAVGRGVVDAGGKFEALIGVGYAIGPAAALGALLAAGRTGGLHPQTLIVMVMWSIVALGACRAVPPYLRALRGRTSAATPSRER